MSVEAVQFRLTCVLEKPVAIKLDGAVGGWVSGAAIVVAVATLE